jgi:hypothetical protein
MAQIRPPSDSTWAQHKMLLVVHTNLCRCPSFALLYSVWATSTLAVRDPAFGDRAHRPASSDDGYNANYGTHNRAGGLRRS